MPDVINTWDNVQNTSCWVHDSGTWDADGVVERSATDIVALASAASAYADSAQASAQDAAATAGGISGYVDAASAYADDAGGYAGTASGYADTAGGYVATVSGYADTAGGYATAASGYAASAAGSIAAASAYAASAGGYAVTASGYADTASGYAASAGGYIASASAFAAAASGYADTAGNYEASAGGYVASASGYAASASGYADTASSYAASAGSAMSGYVSLGGTQTISGAKTFTQDVSIQKSNPYLNFIETDVARGSGADSGGFPYQGIQFFDKSSALLGDVIARCYAASNYVWARTLSPDGGRAADIRVVCTDGEEGKAQLVTSTITGDTSTTSAYTLATTAYVAGATVTSAGSATSAGNATSAGTATNATSLGGVAASGYVTVSDTQTISGAKTFSESPSIERANPYLNIVETDVQRGSATTGFQGFVFKDKNKADLGGIYFQVSVSSSKPYGYIVLRHEGNASTANTHEIVYRQTTGGEWYFMPNGKTDINLGASGNNRWKEVWSVQPSINTSDERLKDNIDAVPDYVLDAWGDVQWTQFQMRDAIAEKGAAFARLHNGLIAQRIDAAFTAHGLDASRYGLFCHDAWEADGEQEAGDEYSLRYTEALAMEAAYQRRRAARAEARIAGLEERLAALEAFILEQSGTQGGD